MNIAGNSLIYLAQSTEAPTGLDLQTLITSGGAIGYVIIGLSIVMVMLILQQLLTWRRGRLMPHWLAEQAHQLISTGRYNDANELCKKNPCFLGDMIQAGLAEVELGYPQVQKALEDASAEHSARMLRKVEYLNVIGTMAPMLGLLGTVWGMVHAFAEFKAQASPSIADFAPSISYALITTVMGLCVAIPALGAFAMMRNRVDELVSETSLLAEQIFAGYKRLKIRRKQASTTERGEDA